MKTDKPHCMLPAYLLFTALILSAQPSISASGSRSALMPEDSSFYVSISDVSSFVGNISESPLIKLLDAPETRDFLGNPDYAGFLQTIFADNPDSEEFARLFMEDLKLLKGEAILAVSPDHNADHSIRFLAEISENDYEKSLALSRRMAELRPERTVFSTEEFAGVKILKTVIHSDTKTLTSWHAHLDNTVIGSHDRDWLEKTIIALKDNPVKTPEQQPPELEIRISLDYVATTLEKSWNSIRPAARGDSGNPTKSAAAGITAKNIMDALGIEKSAELIFSIKPGKSQLEQLTILKSQPREYGIWTLFEKTRPNMEQALPFIPENLYSWKSEALNLNRLWDNIPKILETISPGSAGYFNMVTAMIQSSLGLDLPNDILSHLDPHYSMFANIADNQPKTLVYWKLGDERALSASAAKLFSDQSLLRPVLGESFSTTDFRGYDLYSIDINQGPEHVAVGIAIAGGNLIVGEIELVRSALRSLASGIASDSGFLQSSGYDNVRKLTPDGCYSYGYTDWPLFYRHHLAEVLKKAFDNAEKNTVADENEEIDSIQTFLRGIDTSKMPDPDYIASFLGPAIYYSIITDKGMKTKTVFLYPEKNIDLR